MSRESQNGNSTAFSTKTHGLKVIALDCDGVLFDSREANIRFYSHIMEVSGLPPLREDQHEYIHMYPVRESLLYLIGSEGEAFERAFSYFERIDFEPFNGHLQKEPGLEEFLTLARRHCRTALATNRTTSTLELLRHFDLSRHFDLVVCASDVRNPKPHPEIMERIFSTFGTTRPEQVLYIGDSKVDETLALATGVLFVAYKNPNLRADLHVNHFDELGRLFPGDSES